MLSELRGMQAELKQLLAIDSSMARVKNDYKNLQS